MRNKNRLGILASMALALSPLLPLVSVPLMGQLNATALQAKGSPSLLIEMLAISALGLIGSLLTSGRTVLVAGVLAILDLVYNYSNFTKWTSQTDMPLLLYQLEWGWGYWLIMSIALVVSGLEISRTRRENELEREAEETVATEEADERKCEFCAETIKAEAKICKHCGKEQPQYVEPDETDDREPLLLAQTESNHTNEQPDPSPKRNQVDLKRPAMAVLIIIVAWFGVSAVVSIVLPAIQAIISTQRSPVVSYSESGTVALATKTSASDFTSDEGENRFFVVENDVMSITFASKGALITSITLKKATEVTNDTVTFGLDGNVAFQSSFGSPTAEPIDADFLVSQIGPLKWEFSRSFNDLANQPFRFTKTYTLRPDEYLIKVDVGLTGASGVVPKLNEPFAYSISLFPKQETRASTSGLPRFYCFDGSTRFKISDAVGTSRSSASRLWSALDCGDFVIFGIPDATSYETTFFRDPSRTTSALVFSRPSLRSSTVVDTIYFYVGPKSATQFRRYDLEATNGFGLSRLQMEKISNGIPFFD